MDMFQPFQRQEHIRRVEMLQSSVADLAVEVDQGRTTPFRVRDLEQMLLVQELVVMVPTIKPLEEQSPVVKEASVVARISFH